MIQRTYIFDTNIVSGLLYVERRAVLECIRTDQTNLLVLCDPVIYEIERGLKHKNANRQLERLQRNVFLVYSSHRAIGRLAGCGCIMGACAARR